MVLTPSVANVLGIPMISAYAATKAALRSMTRGLARELLARQIRVNAVSPGAIDTGVLERSLPKEAAEQTKTQMTQSNPTQRLGNPEEVARALIFLAFEATFATGAELAVDAAAPRYERSEQPRWCSRSATEWQSTSQPRASRCRKSDRQLSGRVAGGIAAPGSHGIPA